MRISSASRNLPIILALLEKGWTWTAIVESDNIYHAYYEGNPPEKIYPYELGGSGLNEKVLSFLSPFMVYVYNTLKDYMLNYKLTWQEGVMEYQTVLQSTYSLFPRNAYREFEVLEMDYIDTGDNKNLEVIFPSEALFFYTHSAGITHIKKEY